MSTDNMSDNVSDIMPSGRSKRAAATAAESLISKVVDVEKDFERYSRSKKSKYDFDGDYFDDGDDAWSVDSDSNCPRWYRNFKHKMEMQKQEEEDKLADLSEYERIRLRNIAERQKMFGELELGDLVSSLSKKKLSIKDEIWRKLCESASKKEDFSEDEMVEFFEAISSPKSTPNAIENNFRNVARMYYMKTEQDFFEDFPNIYEVIERLKAACENIDWMSLGTKRTQGTNEETLVSVADVRKVESAWKQLCDYTKKTEDFKEDEIISFLKDLVCKLPDEKVKYEKLKVYNDYISAAYILKTNQKFDEAFPNIQEFIQQNSPEEKGDPLAWKQFCALNYKENNFNEKDVLAYVKMHYEKLQTANVDRAAGKTYEHMLSFSRIFFAKTEIDIWEDFPNIPHSRKEMDAYFNNPSLFEDLKSLRCLDDFKNKDVNYSEKEITLWRDFCAFNNKKSDFTEEDFMDYFEKLAKTPSKINPRLLVSTETLLKNTKILAKIYLAETRIDIWRKFPELPKNSNDLEKCFFPDRAKQKEKKREKEEKKKLKKEEMRRKEEKKRLKQEELRKKEEKKLKKLKQKSEKKFAVKKSGVLKSSKIGILGFD